MKKQIIFVIVGILIILLGVFIFLRGFSLEDTWIKDSRGVWISHGNPSFIPKQVYEQQEAINCAKELYHKENNLGVQFSSQCLGKCGNYSIDIVHFPRDSLDDLIQNQCEDYRNGITKNFIELNLNGEIVKIN